MHMDVINLLLNYGSQCYELWFQDENSWIEVTYPEVNKMRRNRWYFGLKSWNVSVGIDPLGLPTITVIIIAHVSVRPSVPTFQNIAKQTNIM